MSMKSESWPITPALGAWVGTIVALGACAGTISPPGSGGSGDSGDGTGRAVTCVAETALPGAAPLRRLSRTEYQNAVRDLFAGMTIPKLDLPSDKPVDGFDNNVATQAATPILVESYGTASRAITQAIPNVRTFMGCDPAAAACASQFIRAFGARAFRRPPLGEDVSRYEAFFREQATRFGPEAAGRLLTQAMLLAPQFLYRPEMAQPDPGNRGRRSLDGYEVATRLSFFLWQTIPDPDLLNAAERGELVTLAGVEKQARRMLADARALAAVGDFSRQWLGLERTRGIVRDRMRFPAFDSNLPQALYDATVRYVERAFWEGGTVSSLLTEPRAFANGPVARLYGLPGDGRAEMALVSLDPKQRAGLLTQAGVMAGLAHEQADAPILRGTYVLEHFLCAPSPPPPPEVPDIAPGDQADRPRTTRQRVEELHSLGGCQACHHRIDPLGFLFSHYDALGQYRTVDNNLPVKAAAKVAAVAPDIDGMYSDAIELSAKLAASRRVNECFTRQIFRFALGRTESDPEICAIAEATKAAKGNLRELLVQLPLTHPFRYLRSPE